MRFVLASVIRLHREQPLFFCIPVGLIEDTAPSARGVAAFFIAAIAGMAFIVLAKLGSLSQAEVTAIPIAILFAYALVLFRWRRLILRDDQSGDNLYYLGFLYTLTSIAVSLYQFSLTEGGQEQIITNFGIAIATTIVGLALRVMFNQMRQDPAEVERVARLELAEAARRLRREIDQVVVEMNVFQRTVQQSLADHQRTLQDRLAESLKDSAASFADISKTMRNDFGDSADEFAQGAETFSTSAAAADKALGSFTERLDTLTTSELLIEQLGPAVAKVETLIDEFKQTNAGHAERLNTVAAAIESAAGSMRDSTRVLAEAVEKRTLDHRLPTWRRAFEWLARRSED